MLKDNEIAKALECCKTGDCDNSPFYGVKEDCEVELPEEALDLINRQKAEIEELNIELIAMRGAANSYKAENEELKKIIASHEKNINFKADYISKILDGKTNYDRLRNMSISELAEFLNDMQTDALFLEGTIKDLKYPVEWEEWLRAEVAEDE